MPKPLADDELEALLAFGPENNDEEEASLDGELSEGNRRRFRRFECRVRTDFEVDGVSGQGLVKSIGLGGFLVSTGSPLKVGDRLRFRILLDGHQKVMRGSGVVVHGSRNGYGLQFDALTPADVWALMSTFHLV